MLSTRFGGVVGQSLQNAPHSLLDRLAQVSCAKGGEHPTRSEVAFDKTDRVDFASVDT